MTGVFGRCMMTAKGRQLLGKHFGTVVEQLVGSMNVFLPVEVRQLPNSCD